MEDRIRAGLIAGADASSDPVTTEMRKFAHVTSGGFTLLFTLAPLLLKHKLHLWPIGLSLVLMSAAYTVPKALVPVNKAWMAVGHALGWVNSRIILSVVFYVIFFPIAVLRRMGKSGTILKTLTYDPDAKSYRVASEQRPREQMEKPF